MKKIIYSASLFLAFTAIALSGMAQNGSTVTGTTTIPGSNIKAPQLLTHVEIPAENRSSSAGVQVSPNPCKGNSRFVLILPMEEKQGSRLKVMMEME